MKTRIGTGLVVVALLSLAAGRSAEACGGGAGGGPVLVAAALVVVAAPIIDISFTIHDLAVDRSSKGSAIAEIALTVPQIALGGLLAMSAVGDGPTFLTLLGLTAIPTALAVHGIYVLTHDETEEQRLASRRRSWALAPGPVTDGVTMVPGLMGVGRF